MLIRLSSFCHWTLYVKPLVLCWFNTPIWFEMFCKCLQCGFGFPSRSGLEAWYPIIPHFTSNTNAWRSRKRATSNSSKALSEDRRNLGPPKYRNSHNLAFYLIAVKISQKLDLPIFYHTKHFSRVSGIPLRFGVIF